MSYRNKEIYDFSRFHLDVTERKLSCDGRHVPLSDKAFETLCALVRRPGELITKDELMSAVWPDTVVEENNLDQKISILRKALGEKGRGKEKIIETVRGRGYRFLPAVTNTRFATPGSESQISASAFPTGAVPLANSHSPHTQVTGNVVAVTEWQTRESNAREEERIGGEADRAGDDPKNARRNTNVGLQATMVSAVLMGFVAVIWLLFSPSVEKNTLAASQNPSIAVLPFDNLSDDADAEYLSDGITESLINNLSHLPKLRVISRSAVFRYKGRKDDTQAIGRELGVTHVLSGSLKRIGDRIVITIRLDDAETARQIWGNQVVREFTDILQVQASISRDVAMNLRSRFTDADLRLLDKAETARPEVYELYVRGRFFWNKRNKEGVEKAIEEFEKAVEIEPGFALGYVGLADSYLFLWDFADGKASEMLPKARAAIDRALQIDDSLAEAHATSGFIHRLTWQWPEAEAAFRRSVTLNPNYSPARIWFSLYYRNLRNFDQSLSEITKAKELDPLSAVVAANTAYVHILKDDPESAIKECRKAMEIEPNTPLLHELLGIAYLKQGRGNAAVEQFVTAVKLSNGENSRFLSSLGYAYAMIGNAGEANKILKELEKKYSAGEANGMHLAGVYAGLGETDNALRWLERDFALRKGWLPEINWRFAFDGIRQDPGFVSMLQRLGLDPIKP